MSDLARIARAFPLTVLDVGARGGAKDDLRLLAPGVDHVLFEPEPEAHATLAAAGPGPWRSVTALPVALGAREERVTLHICAQAGCSSALTPLPGIGARHARGDYYAVTGRAEMAVRPLDALIAEGRVPAPDFLKIDVQGMEDQVFAGAAGALGGPILGVRTEVSLYPLYEAMPLWSDLDPVLRGHGLWPMRWIESHAWRRQTKAKYPRTEPGLPLPASQGQLVHGDLLYLRLPEDMAAETEADRARLVRLGLLAAAYGLYDHAGAAFGRPGVAEAARAGSGTDPMAVLAALSRRLAARARAERIGARVADRLARLFGAGA